MLYGIPIEYKGVCDVEANFHTYFKLLTNKAFALFKFNNLPETVDETFLKEQLILAGKVCFTQFNGTNIYALNGNLGGEPNCYYEPSQWIVANPVLGSKTVKVRQLDGSDSIDGLEGIVVYLTPLDEQIQGLQGGLYPLIYKYSGLLADNDVSLNIAQINGRMSVAFTADTEAQANSAEMVLRDIYNGRPYRVLNQDILNKITATPLATTGVNNSIMSLIEAHAHLLQDFYSEIGIAANGNLKRERVNTAETELMTGCLDINVSSMLNEIKKGIEKVNELFGTSIEVELNPEVFYPESANATLGEVPEEDPIEEVLGEEETPTSTEEETSTKEETSTEEEPKSPVEQIVKAIEEVAEAISGEDSGEEEEKSTEEDESGVKEDEE